MLKDCLPLVVAGVTIRINNFVYHAICIWPQLDFGDKPKVCFSPKPRVVNSLSFRSTKVKYRTHFSKQAKGCQNPNF